MYICIYKNIFSLTTIILHLYYIYITQGSMQKVEHVQVDVERLKKTGHHL
jgi:hypothetical protein